MNMPNTTPITGNEEPLDPSEPTGALAEFFDHTIHRFGEMFYAAGRERGTLSAGATSLDLEIRTTRLFRCVDGRWRQVHHQGSIEDPDLLARYQAAVCADVIDRPWCQSP